MEAVETAEAPMGIGAADTLLRDSPIEPANGPMTGTNDEAADTATVVDPAAEVSTRFSSTSPSSYTPQFSASQSLILSRIKENELLRSAPPAPTISKPQDGPENKDERPQAHTIGGEATPRLGETLALPNPTGEQPITAAARIRASNAHRQSLKRKRAEANQPLVDFTQSTISFPESARKMPRVQLEMAPPAKTIDGVIDSMREGPDKAMRDVIGEVEKLRARNLAALPRGVVPAKAELVGFPAGRASDLALTEYFYGKKRTDLLNVLSFADQLRPQLLIDVLVSVAKRHPDIPIFDSPTWTAGSPPRAALHNHKLAHRHDQQHLARRHPNLPPGHKPRHGHVLILPAPKRKPQQKSTSRKAARFPPSTSADATPSLLDDDDDNDNDNNALDAEDDDDEDDEENRDSLPPTWPRAGEGLYAKLAPEDRDRELLVDENDEEAFSHFKVDRFGKQMALVLPACG